MKSKLKIKYETPDLNRLAKKHQNFEGLLDAVREEKLRNSRRLKNVAVLFTAVLITSFLSWLYWGQDSSTHTLILPEVSGNEQLGEASDSVKAEDTLMNPKTSISDTNPKPEKRQNPITKNTGTNKVKEREEPLKVEEKNASQASEERTDVNGDKRIEEPEEMAEPVIRKKTLIIEDAKPVSGLENLYEYLYKNIGVPDSLIPDNNLYIEVSFTIQETGAVTEITLSKVLPEDLVESFKNTFRNMPKWTPSTENGNPVASDIVLPITFQKR